MADDKLEGVKKEIRSLLISYQKGTSLSEFRKEYRSMIGRSLPFQDFGYKDEYSFLKAMPDVVKIFQSPVVGDYHLFGIADESVKHIQKMVVKQKASKHKTRYRAPQKVSNAYSSAPSYASNYGSTWTSSKAFGRYEVPPRFVKKDIPKGVDQCVVQMLNNYPNGVKLSQFIDVFCDHYKRQFKFREWGFATLEECLEMIPGITAKSKNNHIIIHLIASNNSPLNHPVKAATVKQEVISKDINNQPSKKHLPSADVQSSKQNPSVPDFFDRDFNKKDVSNQHSKSHSQSSHLGSSTLNPVTPDFFDCNFNKNENKIGISAPLDNFLINRMIQDSYALSGLKGSRDFEETSQPKGHSEFSSIPASSFAHHDHETHITCKNTKADLLDDFSLQNFQDNPTNQPLHDSFKDVEYKDPFAFDSPLVCGLGVPMMVRNNIIKMIEKYPHGIFAVQFTSCYEKSAGVPFDLHSLGFSSLSELVDAVPDILVRKPLKGSKKDWVIFSAKSVIDEAAIESGPGEVSLMFLECIILNVRKILQANPEGIPINSFIHHYSINCIEPLYIRDLGFDNLEKFLMSIASRIPLEIKVINGEKVVTHCSFQDIIKPPVSPLQKPTDIAPFDAKFKPYELPSDFDFSKFYPIYTSSIANPGLLYIQFVGEDTSEALKILYDEIDTFYNGISSDLYRMKPVDIKPNALCVALWPSDKHWYRARITSIVSLDFVQVFYEDYATTDEIPINMLRYIKNDYVALPTQAIKSRLAYLKPSATPGQSTPSWDKRTRKRLLQLCQDRPLMAKIENINKDGVLAVIMCDTSREDMDLYINDVLIEDKLAEVCGEPDEQEVAPTTPVPNMQQLIELMKYMASNPALASQFQTLSSNVSSNQTLFGLTPQQTLLSMCQQFPNPLVSPNLNAHIPSFGNSLNVDATAANPPPKYPPGLNIQPSEVTVPKTTDISELSPLDPSPPLTPSADDDELFDDEDDEYFEQLLYQKNINAKKRYVKRVKTIDGYTFHVLLYDSQSYISSGDISILIWHAKNPSYLFHKLQAQEIELASITLMENGNEEFFAQLERFQVKGIEKMGSETSVLLYPLSKGNQILNLFGHPSATLRAKINTEIATFNPSSAHWQELPDSEVPEELEDVRIVTDDDKMNRLCLYDLKTMREGIRCKRLKLVLRRKDLERINPDLDEEINKLNQLSNKVRERIVEIEQIISMFSERKS